MQAIKTTAQDGDLAQGRNITAGGDIMARGDMRAFRNLTVEGWLLARNVIGPCRGLFRTAEGLEKCVPDPPMGWWALVGDGLPAEIYLAEGGKWVATGKTGGDQLLLTDDAKNAMAEVKALTDYLSSGLIDPESVAIEAGTEDMTLGFDTQKPDDSRHHWTVKLPAAGEKAGVMTAAQVATLTDAVKQVQTLGEALTELQGHVKDGDKVVAELGETVTTHGKTLIVLDEALSGLRKTVEEMNTERFVVWIRYWGSAPDESAQVGDYHLHEGKDVTKLTRLTRVKMQVEGSEEMIDTVAWLDIRLRQDTIYLNHAWRKAFVWDGTEMAPLSTGGDAAGDNSRPITDEEIDAICSEMVAKHVERIE